MDNRGRDNYIDFLRFIGLTLIILAHVDPPSFLFQFRTFDVPLMVFISGLAYSGRRIEPSVSSFYWPRFKRILIPTYLFLSIYFIFLTVLKMPFTVGTVVKSFLLLTEGSIGYVWIIRVFLLITLGMPLLSLLNERLSGWCFYLVLCCMFIVECFFTGIIASLDRSRWLIIIKETVPYFLGYSVFFLLGLKVRSYSPKLNLILLAAVTVIAMAALSIYMITRGLPVDIHEYKYPPTSYFVVYGVFVCTLLWYLKRFLQPFSNNEFVMFIGRNTIWIYFWHVFMIALAYKLFDNWAPRYFLSYFGAIVFFFVQYKVARYLIKKTQWRGFNYLIG